MEYVRIQQIDRRIALGAISYIKTIFKDKQLSKYKRYILGNQPIYTDFGNSVYFSDFVNNAIDRVATEISKIDIKSVIINNSSVLMQNDDITRLFMTRPNPIQTTSDFLSQIEWLRRKYRNAYIYPKYTTITTPSGKTFKKFEAFYPLNPTDVDIGVGLDDQVWEIQFNFSDGSSYTIPYSEIIHIKWRRGCNPVLGGNDNGLYDDKEMLMAIKSLDNAIEGLPKTIAASTQINGVYSVKTVIEQKELDKNRDKFEEHLAKSKSGIVATDFGGEFTPVNIRAADIPKDTLSFIKAVIQEKYGISPAIMSGDYNGEQHSAFYQTAIEEFIIQFEQAFSAAAFGADELSAGHWIKGYYSRTAYMSNNDKLEYAKLATSTRLSTLNEIRDMFGQSPFDGGNVRLQSLNYADSEIVNEYQIKTSKGEKTNAK